jgi:hypothetical protein
MLRQIASNQCETCVSRGATMASWTALKRGEAWELDDLNPPSLRGWEGIQRWLAGRPHVERDHTGPSFIQIWTKCMHRAWDPVICYLKPFCIYIAMRKKVECELFCHSRTHRTATSGMNAAKQIWMLWIPILLNSKISKRNSKGQ